MPTENPIIPIAPAPIPTLLALTVLLAMGAPNWSSALLASAAQQPAQLAGNPPAPSDEALLEQWLERQAAIKTWSAQFTQTRTLKALSEPLTASGRVWFAAPNRFRWELGDPPQTVAVRQPEQMLVLYPRLQRAEKYSFAGSQAGPWKEALLLLEAGFPQSRAEMETRFRITSRRTQDGIHELVLQPRSAAARRIMPRLQIAFGLDDFTLRATELHFSDGSVLRNEFASPQVNVPLADELFAPDLSGFKVAEPGQERR